MFDAPLARSLALPCAGNFRGHRILKEVCCEFGTLTPDEAYSAGFDAFSLRDNSVIDGARAGPWCLG